VSRSALWITALAATLAAAVWQRVSGPSFPWRGTVALGGAEVAVVLPRSHLSTGPARVAVPAAGRGELFWRRAPTADPFAVVPMRSESGSLVAELPAQPPAGTVEYFVVASAGGTRIRVPARPGETVVLRFRGPIPAAVLLTHIVVMFAAMLLGVRAGLGAALEGAADRRLTALALLALTVGGLVVGPLTERYAFGEWWAGVPFGWDLTDNKTLVAWLGWAAAAAAIRWRPARARWTVVLATLLMLAAFCVPHSVLGSRLAWNAAPPAARGRP